jgi:hypothetical protein
MSSTRPLQLETEQLLLQFLPDPSRLRHYFLLLLLLLYFLFHLFSLLGPNPAQYVVIRSRQPRSYLHSIVKSPNHRSDPSNPILSMLPLCSMILKLPLSPHTRTLRLKRSSFLRSNSSNPFLGQAKDCSRAIPPSKLNFLSPASMSRSQSTMKG